MPYIDSQSRDRLNDPAKPARQRRALNAGELTYQLQQVLLTFIEDRELKYQTLAECLGALEGAKLDLIERVVKPYEAKKAEENGDVWPDSLTGVEDYILTHPDVQSTFAAMPRLHNIHTCSAECPCHTGGTPMPDFIGEL